MSAEIVTSLITVAGAVILAVVTYALTKKREREAVLRAERLAHYKDFCGEPQRHHYFRRYP